MIGRPLTGIKPKTAAVPSLLVRRVSPTVSPYSSCPDRLAPCACAICLSPSDIHHPSFCDMVACDNFISYSTKYIVTTASDRATSGPMLPEPCDDRPAPLEDVGLRAPTQASR